MSSRFVILTIITFVYIFSNSSCKRKNLPAGPNVPDSLEETNLIPEPPENIKEFSVTDTELHDTIIGDTIWVHPYTKNLWTDTIEAKGYKAIFSVRVDTNDFIIDTVETSQGGRIAVGYNHLYKMEFFHKNKSWFSVEFNKKDQLEQLIGGTDFWLQSNLDVFHRLVYNKDFGKFIVEFNINPSYNYGSDYYFVFDTLGNINYTGTIGSWGGGNTDGVPFLTTDGMDYITCFEIFNFKRDTAVSISEFSSLAEIKTSGKSASVFQWLYATRDLTKNNFLLIYNREGNDPEYNALILSTDTVVVGKFKYYGLLGEMDAMLLYKYVEKLKKYFLYDTERGKLICINEANPGIIKEISLESMYEVDGDTMSLTKFTLIDFDTFGSYRFYKAQNDTNYYFDIEKFE
jgi:hypothetical protein